MTSQILLVIPCLNEERHIEPLVEQLLADTQELPVSIVIADGGSSDGTITIASRLAKQHDNIHYLHNPKHLQSAAMNLAVETYGKESEFVIRIDAHADYPSNYCHVLLEEAQEKSADSVVVSMITKGKTPFQNAAAAAQNSKLGNGGSAHRTAGDEGRWIDHGHHALMRIKTFRQIGGYDESFSHNEDAELDARLTQAGGKIWLTAKTALTYYPRETALGLFKQYRNYGRGRARMLIKHRHIPKIRQLMPVAILPAALLALLAPFCWLMIVPCMAWASLCLAYGLKIGHDAKSLQLMLSGPAAMIMHFAWSLGFWQSAVTELYKRISV